MVFQSFNLYPHMTALGNVTLALRKVAGKSRAEADALGRAALDAGRPRRPRRPHAGPALGRPAAARGDRPRHRAGAARHAVRRADQRARPGAGGLGAGGHARAARERHDHDRGQPRDGLRPQRRRPRAVHGRRRDRRAGAARRRSSSARRTSAPAPSSARSSGTDQPHRDVALGPLHRHVLQRQGHGEVPAGHPVRRGGHHRARRRWSWSPASLAGLALALLRSLGDPAAQLADHLRRRPVPRRCRRWW